MSDKDCIRCGNESLADYSCAKCGEIAVVRSDGSHFLDEEGLLFETIADEYDTQVVCAQCGSEIFEVEYDEYCSWCRHQEDRDLDKGE